MARPPHAPPPLTGNQLALVDGLELFVEGVLGTTEAGPDPIVITLPVTPDAAVAAELRRRYLEAGWPRVVLGQGPGDGSPWISLESVVDVHLSRRPE